MSEKVSAAVVRLGAALELPDYAALRAYSGPRKSVYVTGVLGTTAPSGIAGMIVLDPSDTTSADNGGTCFVDALGRRWKRPNAEHGFAGWWDVKGDGVANDTAALAKAMDSSPYVELWPGAVVLLSRTYDDGSAAGLQYSSYAIAPTKSCVLDLKGGTLRRARIGAGDAISMYKVFHVKRAGVRVQIRNGVIDMNNHNARFAAFEGCAPDSGIEKCEFINTRNNGTPRTVLPESAELVVIRNASGCWVRGCKMYVGADGDKSGNAAKSYDNPAFGVRITTAFVTVESNQVEVAIASYVEDCQFYGPFGWQPVEIAGTGTRRCWMRNIHMHKPILSMIDMDKGCKECWAENITIDSPEAGIAGAPAGGNGFAVARFQGYTVGSETVYCEDCWADNITVINPPYALSDTTDTFAVLVMSTDARRCRVSNVRVLGNGKKMMALYAAGAADGLELSRVAGTFGRITYAAGATAVRILECDLGLYDAGLIMSGAYLNSAGVNVQVARSRLRCVNPAPFHFLNTFDNAAAQPTIELLDNTLTGFNSAVRTTGTAAQPNIRIAGNTSFQKIASLYNTVPPANVTGNNEVLM